MTFMVLVVMLTQVDAPTAPPPLLPADGSRISTGVSHTEPNAAALLETEIEDGRLRRVGFGFGLALPGVAGVVGLTYAATQHAKSWRGIEGLGFGTLWVLAAVGVSMLIPLGSSAGFHAAGGESSVGWAFLGYGIGLVVASVSLIASIGASSGLKIPLYALAGVAGAVAPVTALELRHGPAARTRLAEEKASEWTAGLMPMSGGAMVAVGRSF